MMKYLFILLFLMAITSHGQTEIPADSLQEVLEDAGIEQEEDEEFPAWEK
jgi:ribosomal protein L12E/L44/L45/RPP1/RPP2